MEATKPQTQTPKQHCVGWMAGAAERFKATRQYLHRTFRVDTDKWNELRFEWLCRYAEHIAAGGDYHLLISEPAFVDAFHYQWLKHDVLLFDEKITGDYEAHKRALIASNQFHKFLFEYVNAHSR